MANVTVTELALCTNMKLFFFEWHEKDFHCGKINFTTCISIPSQNFIWAQVTFTGKGTTAPVKAKKRNHLLAWLKHPYEKMQQFNDFHAFLLVSAFWKQEEHQDKKQKGDHLQLHRHPKEPLQHIPSQKDSHCLLAGRSVRYLWWRLS